MTPKLSRSSFFLIFASALSFAQLLPDDPVKSDFYCGWDWAEANQHCEFHCPSGLDSDCPPLPNGRKRRCIAAAGCYARFQRVYFKGVVSLLFDKDEHMLNNGLQPTTTTTNDADDADDSDQDQLLHSKVNEIGGGNVVGSESLLMTTEESTAFEQTFEDYLFKALKEQIQIAEVSVRDQQYDRPCVQAVIGDGDDSTTALDMEIRVIGEYIPTTTLQLLTDEEFSGDVLSAVNTDQESFIDAIKSSSSFFEAISGVSAIDEEEAVEEPSESPSAAPTRGLDQSFDVRIDPRPTGSYGIVFDVRTPPGGNTILVTGLSFVTLHEGTLEYEVYTKEGPFEQFVGRTGMFDLVASGQVEGKGSREYTRILDEDTTMTTEDEGILKYIGFKPHHILGNRGQRSFYITITKRYKTEDGGPIPVLFSSPKGEEGKRDYELISSNGELEVYEGDGVLDYPWVNARDGPYYRRPRGFIGSFDYNRNPCWPTLNFTGWPCPYVAKTRRPTARPTKMPTDAPITMAPIAMAIATNPPTKDPSNPPTDIPTLPIDNTETNAPSIAVTDSGQVETNDNDAPLESGIIEEEPTSNAATKMWKMISYGCFCFLGLCGVILG